MYDSVLRSDRQMCISHIDHVDAFFCFEQSDVNYYKQFGKIAYFMPMACDTHVYFPIKKEKTIDILFVGTIYISPKRIKFLKRLIKEFPDKKILIYGIYKPYFKSPIKWLFREKRTIFKNQNLKPNQVNELYAKTKVALNIHNAQTFNGANPRLFEASGAKVYQVCDTNPFIESIFPNHEIGLYSNEDEMIAAIRNGLEHDHQQQIDQAYDIIIQNHTFNVRVETMLKTIGLL